MNEFFLIGAEYVVFLLAILVIWFIWKHPEKEQKKILFLTFVFLIINFVLAKIAGYFYFNPRPVLKIDQSDLLLPLSVNAFPSMHTLISGTLALAVLLFNKKIGIWFVLLALWVGVSRVFIGAHSWVDVIASWCIVFVVYALAEMIGKKKEN